MRTFYVFVVQVFNIIVISVSVCVQHQSTILISYFPASILCILSEDVCLGGIIIIRPRSTQQTLAPQVTDSYCINIQDLRHASDAATQRICRRSGCSKQNNMPYLGRTHTESTRHESTKSLPPLYPMQQKNRTN